MSKKKRTGPAEARPEPEKAVARYGAILSRIFGAHFREGVGEFVFAREEIVRAADELGILLPKTLGDLLLVRELNRGTYLAPETIGRP